MRVDDVVIGQEHRTFDAVLKFAHISPASGKLISMSIAGVEMRRTALLLALLYFSTKWSARSRMSVLRSRRGGMWMGNTLSR